MSSEYVDVKSSLTATDRSNRARLDQGYGLFRIPSTHESIPMMTTLLNHRLDEFGTALLHGDPDQINDVLNQLFSVSSFIRVIRNKEPF